MRGTEVRWRVGEKAAKVAEHGAKTGTRVRIERRGDQREKGEREKGKELKQKHLRGMGEGWRRGEEQYHGATQRDGERLSRSLNKQQRRGPKGIG